LYSFDLFTGASSFIGNFSDASLSSFGMSGLAGSTEAPIPEPGTMMLLGTGLAGVAALRRRFKR
jgi:hypothetical protein